MSGGGGGKDAKNANVLDIVRFKVFFLRSPFAV